MHPLVPDRFFVSNARQNSPCSVEKSLYRFWFVSVWYAACGEVTERPMVLAWKAGVVKATRGSNPRLSAILELVRIIVGLLRKRQIGPYFR